MPGKDMPSQPGSAPNLTQHDADNAALVETVRQLQARESHLLGLLGSAPDSVLGMNTQGLVTDWNPGAERILGWSREEALGRRMSELIIPLEYRDAHEQGMRRYLETGVARVLNRIIEIQALHKDGHVFPVELSIWPISNGHGHGFGAFIRDVSERQRAQESLRNSEERYRSVVEHLGEGMLVIRDGLVVFANLKASEVLRVPHGQLIGADYLQWLHPDDREATRERQRRRQAGEQVVDRYELRRLDADGTVRWMETHATRATWEGKPATISFFSDIDTRRAMMEAVQRSEERYRSVVEHLGEGMFVALNDHIVFANRQASDIMRVPPEELLGADPVQWIHPDDRAAVLDLRTRLRQRQVIEDRYETRHIGRDGVVRWLSIRPTPVAWEGSTATLTFLSEITERKAMVEALQRSEERYRAVIEHVDSGMVVLQGDRLVYANPRAAEITRMSHEDILKVGYLHRVHPEDHPLIQERRRRRLAGENVPNQYEVRLLFEDGSISWIELGVSVVPWDGQPATITFFTDVTQRKQMTLALHRSEERYRAVIEHSGEGMMVVQDGRFVFVNHRAAELARMSREEMLREGYLHRVHPGDHALVDERRRRRLAGENVSNRYEVRLLMPDGEVRWIDIGVTVVPWDGAPATLTFFSDVTERKQLEGKLKETLEERETILDNTSVGIAFLNPDGRLRWGNRAIFEMFGAGAGDERRASLESLYLSRDQYLRIGAEVGHALANGQTYQTELQMRRLDGQEIWVALSCKAVSLRDQLQGALCVLTDITQRRKLEHALQRTSSEREAILNSALVGIVLSVNRAHEWVNEKFAEMVGYQREELMGQSSRMVHVDEQQWDRLGRETREALAATGTYSTERQLKRRNGDLFWVQMAGRCVRGNDPDSGVIWTFLDITQRRKAEQDTRAALEQQRELNELRTRFVAMTSHEFRTPLATILSSAELLKYYGDRLPEAEKADVIKTIESGVHRMARMLDRVLLLGRAEAQMLEFRPREIDLAALCRTLVEDARTQQPNSSCEVVTEFTGLPPKVSLDDKLLRHIFGNLLSNAIKYSPQGGQVRFRIYPDKGQWVFEVSDQGIGIPADEVPHLFASFHRASNVGDIQGTGLGLAIVKNSVDLHRGSIEVASTAGVGTCFTVRL
jgi:PAS domain S-box-containing protein